MYTLKNMRATEEEYVNSGHELPDEQEIEVGDTVKLVFQPEVTTPGCPSGERMWVKIGVAESAKLAGVLMNSPVLIEGLKYGDRVVFKRCHVADLIKKES